MTIPLAGSQCHHGDVILKENPLKSTFSFDLHNSLVVAGIVEETGTVR